MEERSSGWNKRASVTGKPHGTPLWKAGYVFSLRSSEGYGRYMMLSDQKMPVQRNTFLKTPGNEEEFDKKRIEETREKEGARMSLISDYEQRTVWKYEPIHGSFSTADGLTLKVNEDGSYRRFSGSTVVIRPEARCFQSIQRMQRVLLQQLKDTDMLAERLPASTIHMTLHDLISPEVCSMASAQEYNQKVEDSISRAADIAEEVRKRSAGQKITMVSDRIVNMVSKSLVLMLRPKTEQDYEMLLQMRHPFDAIQTFPYPFTPHITLAYFRPGVLNGDLLGKAVDYAQIRQENAPVFEFYPEGLTVQRFLDMKTYMDVPERICFCCDGGLNRSVMAANILNDLAGKRKLPVTGQARAAFPDTQGWMVSELVWKTLEKNGISPDRTYSSSRYLEERELSWFTAFAGISDGALGRLLQLNLPEEKVTGVSHFFYGVRDPEYGEITHEQAFRELYDRTEKYLDAYEAVFRKHVGG